MISNELQKKISESKDILILAAQMSKEYYQKPLIITYSGGKDSDVMLQLAIECLQPEDFEVQNNHTTVDAPETVYYIRDRFKELQDMGIKSKIIYHHYKDGQPLTMWNLIPKKSLPPTRLVRYCCSELKESSTSNRFIATGVREQESSGRKGRDVFATRGSTKKDAYYYYYSHIKEVFEDDKQRRKQDGIGANEEGVYDCIFISQAKKNKELLCQPIYKWTEADVWTFIHDRGMPYNPLYDEGFKRIGCIGCPLAGKKNQLKQFQRWPKYKNLYLQAFDRMLKERERKGKEMYFRSSEDVFDWWVYGISPDQMRLSDFDQEN